MRWLESTWWCALLYTAGFSWATGFVSIIIRYLYTEWNSNPGFDHSHTHTAYHGRLSPWIREWSPAETGRGALGSVGHPCWNFTNTNLRGNVFYLRHKMKEWMEINNLVSCWPSCVIPNPTVCTEWDLKGWWVCHKLLKYVQGENSVQPIVPIQRHQISISC